MQNNNSKLRNVLRSWYKKNSDKFIVNVLSHLYMRLERTFLIWYWIEVRLKFSKDKRTYRKQSKNSELFAYKKKYEYKILYDYKENAGSVDPHYFLQDIFVAKYVMAQGFSHVYDIGSRLDGYIAHLLSGGVKVSMIDIRPFPIAVDNLDFIQGDATDLYSINDNSLPILTSLHAIEHFGLGRYGDRIDYLGWKKALVSFSKKVISGGTLIISMPVGNKDICCFNAHRIFNPLTIFNVLYENFNLISFSNLYNYNLTTKDFENIADDEIKVELAKIGSRLENYECGIFIFKKK